MKNLIQSTFLLLAILLPTTASAYDFEVDGIYYKVSGTNATVTYKTTDYNSYNGDIVIPESFTHEGTTYTVKAIGVQAFYDCTDLTSVSIPNTVTSIGSVSAGKSFANCINLSSIEIPDNVSTIGRQSFANCTGLRSVTIGKSVRSLHTGNYYAFQGCNGITDLTWNAANCQDKGGMGTTNIEQVTIGPEVVRLPNAFVKDSKIQHVDIPNSVRTIGSSAFEACVSLTNVNIPNSTTIVDTKAFFGCTGLTDLNIGNSVTTIGSQAFNGCTNLQRVNISNLEAWCSYQFDRAEDNPIYYAHCLYLNEQELTDLVIPNDVTTIGNYAFFDCSGLTSVTIPNTLTTIGLDAFVCENLTRVNISSIENWCRINFQSLESNPLTFAEHLYLNNVEVTDVVIPDGLTAIGNYAFYSCKGLKSITISNTVEIIGLNSFAFCPVLTDVRFGNSVTVIGDMAFYGTGLSSVTIPNTTNHIGYEAFAWCSLLKNIIVESGNPIYDSRDNCNAIIETSTNTLLVGCANTSIPHSVTKIAARAFYGCELLTSLFIPNSVTSIEVEESIWLGSSPFGGCNELTNIIVEDGNPVYDSRDNCNAVIETASNTLMAGCKNTIIPNTVIAIGSCAFSVCQSLKSIEIPNSVTSIGDYAFNQSGLTSITIGNSVKSIGEAAFTACIDLTSLDLGSSVTTICDDAFAYCIGLTNVCIPNSVTVTEPYTARTWFRECSSLTSVTIGSGMAYMGLLFMNCPNISKVTSLSTEPPKTDRYQNTQNHLIMTNFDAEVYEQATLYVPVESLEAYKTATYWSLFQDIKPLGDVDGDDAVGIGDVADLIDMLLSGNISIADCPAGDADGDGRITIADVSEIIDHLLNGI